MKLQAGDYCIRWRIPNNDASWTGATDLIAYITQVYIDSAGLLCHRVVENRIKTGYDLGDTVTPLTPALQKITPEELAILRLGGTIERKV